MKKTTTGCHDDDDNDDDNDDDDDDDDDDDNDDDDGEENDDDDGNGILPSQGKHQNSGSKNSQNSTLCLTPFPYLTNGITFSVAVKGR